MARGTQSIIDLRPFNAAVTAVTRRFRNGNGKNNLDEYFGPGVEIAPIAPEAKPEDARGWQYWPFINQTFIPRPDATYTAQQLRALALYPLARTCIENNKDVIVNMPRQIRAKKQPGEKNADVDKRSKGDPVLKMLNAFFDCPDGDHMWDEWLRPFLEDQYVIDAAAWLVERDSKGKPAILRYIDGAFINCQIDVRGVVQSYQALWSGTPSTIGGIPFIDLSKDQLVYAPRNLVPRNTVASYLYGMSQTEQLAPEIQIGSARLGFILSYYTDGEIPDGIHVVPPNVSGDQLRASQKAMEAELTGLSNLYKRHHILLHQGFVDRTQAGGTSGDQILFPKSELLNDPEQEFHVRKIAFGYGTAVQRLMKQMNRASAQSSQEAAEEEGTQPVALWIKNRIDFIIARIFGLGFGNYELTYETQIETDLVKRAQASASDVKEGIITRPEARVTRYGLDAEPAEGMGELTVDTLNGPVPVDPDDRIELTQKMTDAMPQKTAPGEGDEPPPKKKPVGKRAKVKIDPDHWTPALEQAKGRLEHAINQVFMRQKEKATIEASRLLKIKKAEGDDTADKIYKAIELDFSHLPAEARAALEAAAIAGINEAVMQLNLSDSVKISSINRAAAENAAKRAAEMVGMKYSEDGELIANPSAKYAISDTTRDRLREIIKNAFEKKTPLSDVIKNIEDADIFSPKRAELIARTEVSQAQINANFDMWKASGLVKSVKWLAVGPDPCPVCERNDNLVRKIGEEFPSGDKFPTAHPDCYCILIPQEFV